MRVIAMLGGNAFVPPDGRLTMAGQFRFAETALSHLRPLFQAGTELVLTHGNGPQVGHMLIRVEESLGKAYSVPLEVCVAESEGELGYVLEQTLYNLMTEWGCARPIAGLLTQVLVDSGDPAFQNPTKPVGPVYGASEAAVMRRKGFQLREEVGRGFRRVVPSPLPQTIVEAEVIARLLDLGVLVIAAGGGGIPVVREGQRLRGVEAVVDKDLASALLGDVLQAELLLIVTGVPCAYRYFNTPRQQPIGRVDVRQAREMLDEGHFPPGSMGPKVEAAIKFVRMPGRRVVICDPPSIAAALEGNAGTTIVWERTSPP